MLIETRNDLINSVNEFMLSPEYWRDAIGSTPKYFICLIKDNKYFFGLSKFCAFKDITLEDYIVEYRHTIGGGKTQKHISKIIGEDWIPISRCSKEISKKFSNWLNKVTDGKIKLDNIFILYLDSKKDNKQRKNRELSPEDLEKKLKKQREIGELGEKIAIKYEISRLKSLGCKDPEGKVQQVSLLNTASGFDIRSQYKNKVRYIEVKSSISNSNEFFISSNEINTLKKHKEKSFIYLVNITDFNAEKGEVVREIQDPVPQMEQDYKMSPVLFRVKYT